MEHRINNPTAKKQQARARAREPALPLARVLLHTSQDARASELGRTGRLFLASQVYSDTYMGIHKGQLQPRKVDQKAKFILE